MAKRKESRIELLASMRWPIGFVLGIVAYVAPIRGRSEVTLFFVN
jgi:hypothetical protein